MESIASWKPICPSEKKVKLNTFSTKTGFLYHTHRILCECWLNNNLKWPCCWNRSCLYDEHLPAPSGTAVVGSWVLYVLRPRTSICLKMLTGSRQRRNYSSHLIIRSWRTEAEIIFQGAQLLYQGQGGTDFCVTQSSILKKKKPPSFLFRERPAA